jgi:hypothetical protein
MKSESAADGALRCVLALVQRCPALEVGQVAPLLQHACRLLQLPHGAASEEVGVCAACSRRMVCLARQSRAAHPHVAVTHAAVLCATCGASQMRLACCGIIAAALSGHQQQQLFRQPHATAMAGFLAVACLSAAEAEVGAGSKGSKAVRHAAIGALGAVVAALGPGPQLAALLPGLAGGLTKQLMASGALWCGGVRGTCWCSSHGVRT